MHHWLNLIRWIRRNSFIKKLVWNRLKMLRPGTWNLSPRLVPVTWILAIQVMKSGPSKCRKHWRNPKDPYQSAFNKMNTLKLYFRQLWNNERAKRQMTETKHFKQGIIVLIEVNVRFLSLFIIVILPWIYHNFHETIILIVTLVVAFAWKFWEGSRDL